MDIPPPPPQPPPPPPPVPADGHRSHKKRRIFPPSPAEPLSPPDQSLQVFRLAKLPEDIVKSLFEYLYISEACGAKGTSRSLKELIKTSLKLPRQVAVLPQRWSTIDLLYRARVCPKVQKWCVDCGAVLPRDELIIDESMWWCFAETGTKLSQCLRSLKVAPSKGFWDDFSLAKYVPEPAKSFPKLQRASLWTKGDELLQHLEDWSHVRNVSLHVFNGDTDRYGDRTWPYDAKVLSALSSATTMANITALSFAFGDEWAMDFDPTTTRDTLLGLAWYLPKHLTALKFEFMCDLRRELDSYDVVELRQRLQDTLNEMAGVVLARFPELSAEQFFEDTCGVTFQCATLADA